MPDLTGAAKRDGADAEPQGPPAAAALPVIRPAPARLAELAGLLGEIEQSGVYSNYGPVNTRFEGALVARMFGGQGGAVTSCNATIGLMLALKQAKAGQDPRRRYALMPSFSFAATAQAALWAGLTPLLCDIRPDTWLACPDSEAELLRRHAGEVAVLLGCTTFGNPIDLDRYRAVAADHGCAVVVDAAAALGSFDAEGRHFGAGAPEPIIFSMHVTKAFATLEGGVTVSTDAAAVAALRAMGNFGFGEPRSATMPGLNSKLNEVTAAMALAKLDDFPRIAAHRLAIEAAYRAALPEFAFQRMTCPRYAPVFASLLLPRQLGPRRPVIRAALQEQGIASGAYFDPHMARQPYLAAASAAGPLPESDDVASRILNLPMSDMLEAADVDRVAKALRQACATAGA